jgi:hypothetical protein
MLTVELAIHPCEFVAVKVKSELALMIGFILAPVKFPGFQVYVAGLEEIAVKVTGCPEQI